MEKFISIPAAAGNQLVSATNVVAVFAGTAASPLATSTATTIMYQGGKVVTLTTGTAQVASNMRDAIQNAIATALQTSWTETVYVVPTLPIAVTTITAA
jgi:hypothetical protein